MTSPAYGQVPVRRRQRGLSTGAVVGIVAGAVALLFVVIAIGVAVFVHANMDARLTATGVSMEPTIHAGQTVTARTVRAGAYQPKVGDIIVFTVPESWSTGAGDQKMIKRVIGLPGERLACCDDRGRWLAGGKPLAEPYLHPGSLAAMIPTDIRVPDGRLWVMGDNRASSNDSRTRFAASHDITVATIPISSVTAVVVL